MFFVLIVEIVLSLIILKLWVIRLVKKGNQIIKIDIENDCQKNNKKANCESFIDKQLLKLAKAYLKAKLDHNLIQTNSTEKKLLKYLTLEYKKLDKKVMLKKIRFSLIQNPYDQVGRKMAKDTKDLFKKVVLEESQTCDRIVAYFKIPGTVLPEFFKQNWI